MYKGAIAFIILLIIIIILWYVATDFKFPFEKASTSTVRNINISVNSNNITFINGNGSCSNFVFYTNESNSTTIGSCQGSGEVMLWVGIGKAADGRIIVKSRDKVYINQSVYSSCDTYIDTIFLPNNTYNITLSLYGQNKHPSCKYGIVGIYSNNINSAAYVSGSYSSFSNYSSIYNGNFSTGSYEGWIVKGKAFGSAPVDINNANTEMCYPAYPWTGYKGLYFASTYNCGSNWFNGSLTSYPFKVTKPFLNFQVVSSFNNGYYIYLLQNSTPVMVVTVQTFNLTNQPTNYYFKNVTIPLFNYINKTMQIEIVSNLQQRRRGVFAIGNFYLSDGIYQSPNVAVNMTYIYGNQ
ncbi:MAG: hypothetical protein ACP5RP_00925 [Candidatus Micrarchaeia archaeon]